MWWLLAAALLVLATSPTLADPGVYARRYTRALQSQPGLCLSKALRVAEEARRDGWRHEILYLKAVAPDVTGHAMVMVWIEGRPCLFDSGRSDWHLWLDEKSAGSIEWHRRRTGHGSWRWLRWMTPKEARRDLVESK